MPAEFAEVQSVSYSAAASVRPLERTLLRQMQEEVAESDGAAFASQVPRQQLLAVGMEPELTVLQAGGMMAVGSPSMTMKRPLVANAATAERHRHIERKLLRGPDADLYSMLGNIVKNESGMARLTLVGSR